MQHFPHFEEFSSKKGIVTLKSLLSPNFTQKNENKQSVDPEKTLQTDE